ncbi:hypothetical protein [Orenia marismortui]|uniref:Uncharacterized protein n=1 Tax=Orenia marismortui TaxID=46469 RepID=A0A4R8GZI7_9FIRM|nr:hypothetical protein [Orenia marismortui]TDX52181.1 hypothetical protein C7959_108103 [Orenia marismortui]
MNKLIIICLLIISMFTFIGCSDDLDNGWKYDPSELFVGMPKSMVQETWGTPTSTYSSGNYTVWGYTHNGGKGYESYTLTFDSYGLLDDWSVYRSEN